MKKLALAALATVFMAGTAFAAEGDSFIHIRAGVDPIGTLEVGSQSGDMKLGITLSGEYLRQVNDIFSFGVGAEYLIGREIDNSNNNTKLSYLPIYVTVKANPIFTLKEVFVKANLGYNILFGVTDLSSSVDTKGGLYYGLAAGYEFPSGLTLDVSYGVYETGLKYGPITVDYSYSKVGINLGYKFKV
ncbi:MAG: porin family protein [Endomicrobia bacterium]|nr:porin family protein [Endomicrobiia bacterium]